MDYKQKKRIPRRDDDIYKEIENFEDFELINNALYEMGIRTNKFKELEKKYAYCESLSYEINKKIEWDDPEKNIQSQDSTNNEDTPFIIVNRSAKEKFEEAFKRYENDSLKINNYELYTSLELDFELFKEKIQVTSFENRDNKELIEHYNLIGSFLLMIPEIIKKDLYIDFLDYYCQDKETDSNTGIEYEESSVSSLYTKREYKETYYVETTIDDDNNKISKTLHPRTQRKLYTDHIVKFSSNHLIIHKQVIKFLEDFFKTIEVKMKKQIVLANAFFCYDYYKFRVEQEDQKNKKLEKRNLENTTLQDAKDNIEKIDKDAYLTDQQKAQERIQYENTIQIEELKPFTIPTINKYSNSYVFKESNFKKSGIKPGTAYNYYDWIKPYIDNNEYIKIINSTHLF